MCPQENKKYCYMWREGGQFSSLSYKTNENKTTKNN